MISHFKPTQRRTCSPQVKILAYTLTLLSFTLGSYATAEESSDMFLPSELEYYNPLKNHHDKQTSQTHSQALNNQQLEQEAAFMRDHQMTAEQRALNHQWLAQDHAVKQGNKVVSTLVKMGFKTYWTGVHDTHYSNTAVPDESGKVNLDSEVKYHFRLSSSRARIGVEYEF